jgi:hypothetical protein
VSAYLRDSKSAVASTASAAAAGSAAISHSQILTTVQPREAATSDERRSRSTFLAIFCSHSGAFGPVKGVLRPCSGHECQKQPSTKIASKGPGITMSGVQPFASCRCSRKRPPAAWIARRRATSGDVFAFFRPDRCRPDSVETHCELTLPRLARCFGLRREPGSHPRHDQPGGVPVPLDCQVRTRRRLLNCLG